MKKSATTSLFFFIFILISMSAYVFYKTWSDDDSINRQIVDSFIELDKNQMELKQIILKVSVNQNSNFDRLMYLQKRQLNLATLNKDRIESLLKDESSLVNSHIDKYYEAQSRAAIWIESFTRSSAILKNSTSYFIYLGRDFLKALESDKANYQQFISVKNIIADTLIFDLSIKNEMKISNEKNTENLLKVLDYLKISESSNFYFLPKHLAMITKHRQLMTVNMQNILSENSDETIGKAFNTYLNQYNILEQKQRLYSDFMVFIVTSLVLFIAYYVFSLRKTKDVLLEEISKLSTAMEQSHDAVLMTNPEKTIEYINPSFTKVTGYESEEILGKNTDILKSIGDNPEIYAEIAEALNKGKIWRGEIMFKRKSGNTYWAYESISPIFDSEGNLTHYLSTHRDITEQYLLHEKVTFHASHDVLTGLVNRREFEHRAEQLIISAEENDSKHALCFMDLDQFKVVNDSCGHAAGDELLRQLGLALKKVTRQRDTLARLGGDEFGVLIENCSLKNAMNVAKTLKQTIQDYQFSWEGRNFKIGVSIGLVAINNTLSNLTELMKNADASCYMAKEMGRNRIHVYNEKDSEISDRQGQMQWVERINQALEEQRFCLYAQSIVPIDGGSELHYELLIRMLDQEGNIIPPGAFLPAAERYNLIGKLDRWVITHAFTLLIEHPKFLEKINFVSINLSGQSLADAEFLKFVFSKFKQTKIPPNKICFEITETAAISNLHTATLFIEKMKQLGSLFALDDFGSGLSSFGYLKNLPVDYLKIDGMFVKDMVEDPIDRAMVKSINEIGHVMGMKTIAEFVESNEIKTMLTEIGVNYAQGYGVGKPQPFDELLE